MTVDQVATVPVSKVLVVDNSAFMRQLLTRLINRHPSFTVVGTAADPYIARAMIKDLNPDVLTLDIEMPRMNGLKFLDNLMRLRPMPVVMISASTSQGSSDTAEALRIGAIGVVVKPDLGEQQSLERFSERVYQKLLLAANAEISKGITQRNSGVARTKNPTSTARPSQRLLAIGASTGGTVALQDIFRQLPASTPGTLVVQHIPDAFSESFANSLNKSSAMTIKQACDGDIIKQGHAYIAPGTKHLEIIKDQQVYRCVLLTTRPVNRHRPSVDVLFDSVATRATRGISIGVLLTGMGTDGAKGLLNMRQTGCVTVAQDETSSVVWGMPGSAVKLDAAQYVRSLSSIPKLIGDVFTYTQANP